MANYKERFDVCVSTGTFTARDGSEKTSWAKIGVAFKGEDDSIYGTIDMLPLVDGGKIKFNLFKPKTNDQPQGQQQAQAPQPQGQQWSQQPTIKDPDLPF